MSGRAGAAPVKCQGAKGSAPALPSVNSWGVGDLAIWGGGGVSQIALTPLCHPLLPPDAWILHGNLPLLKMELKQAPKRWQNLLISHYTCTNHHTHRINSDFGTIF